MRLFIKFTILLAMFMLASSGVYAQTTAYTIEPGGPTGSTVAGKGNKASASFSNAFGYENTASADCSSAFGYKNTASDTFASAFGYENTASGTFASAFGYTNTASRQGTSAFGFKNTASGLTSSAFGYANTASGQDSSASGYTNIASGLDSSAFGYKNTASGRDSNAFGYKNTASGQNSSASGYTNIASGRDSSVFGSGSYANADYSTAIGYQAVSKESYTVSFGHDEGDDDLINCGTYSEELNSRLVHVASGTANTDAVNLGQLNKTLENYQSKLSVEQLAAANSGITSAKVTAYDTYITSTGITGGNKRITNVAAATEDTDAVNYGQMKQYVADNAGGSGSDPELKKTIEQHTKDIKQLLASLGSSAEKENKPSEGSIAIGDSNEAGTEENTSMAIGSGNKVTGKDSIAIGYSASGLGNTVSGNNSIAVGFGHQVRGNNSGAFGDPSYIDTDNSYAVGNNNAISGAEGFIVGNNSKVRGAKGMAFGSNSNVTGENGVALGNNTEVSAKNAVAIGEGSKATEENTVSVGSDETKRRITNVDKAQNGTDAVNYDQLKDYVAANAGGGDPQEILRLRSDMGKLDSRISKVGASAAALAALKPMEFDPDNKWSAGVGFGNLNGKSAAAVGIFYRPNRDVYYSLGGNVGGEENIVNAGISFSFGHRSARPAVNQYASANNNEIEAYRQENAELKDKVAAQDSEILTLKNKNEDMEVRMKRLERLIIKMSKELDNK